MSRLDWNSDPVAWEDSHDYQVTTGQPPSPTTWYHPSGPRRPDDLEPLPLEIDGMYQEPHFTEMVQIVRTIFSSEPAVLVSGDTPIYYDDEEGQQRIVRPDCCVAFDVDTVAIMRRNGYFMRLVQASRRVSPWILPLKAHTPRTWVASGTSTPGWASGNTGGSTPQEATFTNGSRLLAKS